MRDVAEYSQGWEALQWFSLAYVQCGWCSMPQRICLKPLCTAWGTVGQDPAGRTLSTVPVGGLWHVANQHAIALGGFGGLAFWGPGQRDASAWRLRNPSGRGPRGV